MPETRDSFVTPMAPSESSGAEPASQRLTNADFRKLMMTPRSGSGAAPGIESSASTPVGALGAGGGATPKPGGVAGGVKKETSERAENRKKKKSYYAKLKKQEDDKMAELAAKYRDRAAERRDGNEGLPGPAVGPDGPSRAGGSRDAHDELEEARARRGGEGGGESSAATSGYRAVAPDMKSSYDAAERRRQMIQESKFLGGDMEHTHLVKGLDFALLQKVRSEITNREKEEQEEAMVELNEEQERKIKEEDARSGAKGKKSEEGPKDKEKAAVMIEADPVAELQAACRTNMAKSLVRTAFKTEHPKCNELFFPGRMAYIIDLEEDMTESNSDIPTTTIRSKADVEGQLSQQTTLSTNDIVINKLTQILSYLRAGSKNRKKKKEKMLQNAKDDQFMREAQNAQRAAAAAAEMPIYDDVGEDYIPDKHRSSEKDRHRDSKRSDRDRDRKDRRDRDRDRGVDHRDSSRRHERESRHDRGDQKRDRDRDGKRNRWDDKPGASGSSSSKSKSYFDNDDDEEKSKEEEMHKGGLTNQDREYIRRLAEREKGKTKAKATDSKGGMGLAVTDPEGYNECYPGLLEMNDAMDDSDEEADFSKMDLGNKKGPVGRWDFDTTEEYADYMSTKEALPKAAFQYGVKMSEGRKTRGKVGVKNEKAKLDREWNKISAIIDKRKTPGGSGGSSSKKPRME